jgi:hypothetical protein
MQVTQDLFFDRRVQSFTLLDPPQGTLTASSSHPPRRGSLASEIRVLWETSEPADEEAEEQGGDRPADELGPDDGADR